jgi:hypothetical protein
MKNTGKTVGVAVIAFIVGLSVCALAQEPAPALQDELKSIYKLSRTGTDSYGFTMLETGTVLLVKKGGVLAVPPASIAMCPVKYQGGTLHKPSMMCTAVLPTSRYLAAGEKVYVTKIDVNPKANKVQFQLVECDSCNGFTEPSSYKASVVFEFPGKFLDTADPGQVTDVINQLLEPDTAAAPPAQAAVVVAPTPQPPAPPASIQLGDTLARVESILGPPDSKAKVGPKVIYMYKSLKVTFMAGKVSDVQ